MAENRRDKKFCPFCGKEIAAAAVDCPHCGSMLDGVRPEDLLVRSPANPKMITALKPGALIRDYRVLKLLGSGFMGDTYVVQSIKNERRFVLRMLPRELMEDSGANARFADASQRLRKLQHPNILPLHDAFVAYQRYLVVHPYLEGESLESVLLKTGKASQFIPVQTVVLVMGDLLAALEFGHGMKPANLHRGIAAANVFFAKDGKTRLMDFGLASLAHPLALQKRERRQGNYEYVSPEFIRGEALTTASDVYSLGIVLYEMLCGVVPFPQRTRDGADSKEGHLLLTPSRVQSLRPEVPPWLAWRVEKAIEKDAENRFADADEMLNEAPPAALPRASATRDKSTVTQGVEESQGAKKEELATLTQYNLRAQEQFGELEHLTPLTGGSRPSVSAGKKPLTLAHTSVAGERTGDGLPLDGGTSWTRTGTFETVSDVGGGRRGLWWGLVLLGLIAAVFVAWYTGVFTSGETTHIEGDDVVVEAPSKIRPDALPEPGDVTATELPQASPQELPDVVDARETVELQRKDVVSEVPDAALSSAEVPGDVALVRGDVQEPSEIRDVVDVRETTSQEVLADASDATAQDTDVDEDDFDIEEYDLSMFVVEGELFPEEKDPERRKERIRKWKIEKRREVIKQKQEQEAQDKAEKDKVNGGDKNGTGNSNGGTQATNPEEKDQKNPGKQVDPQKEATAKLLKARKHAALTDENLKKAAYWLEVSKGTRTEKGVHPKVGADRCEVAAQLTRTNADLAAKAADEAIAWSGKMKKDPALAARAQQIVDEAKTLKKTTKDAAGFAASWARRARKEVLLYDM